MLTAERKMGGGGCRVKDEKVWQERRGEEGRETEVFDDRRDRQESRLNGEPNQTPDCLKITQRLRSD